MDTKYQSKHFWTDINQTNASGLINYLDTFRATEFSKTAKRRTFDLLDVHKGDKILDVGCGTGEDVQRLAQMVGSSGEVIGVDSSESMINEAYKRSKGKGLPVKFFVGDVHRLNFADNSFDCCRAERIFQHIKNSKQALAEMIRVSKYGANIFVGEPDWETLVINNTDRIVTRKIANFICDHIVCNGWIGRQLPILFKEFGLTDIVIDTGTVILDDYILADKFWRLRENAKRAQDTGIVSEKEITSWLKELEDADKTGHFFGSISGFAVCGRKPPIL